MSTVKLYQIAVYQVFALGNFDEGESAFGDPPLNIALSKYPDRAFECIDRKQAASRVVIENTFRIASERSELLLNLDRKLNDIRILRQQKKKRPSTYAVFARSLDVSEPQFQLRIDGSSFSAGVNGWADASFVDEFRVLTAQASCSLILAFQGSSSERTFRKVDTAAYFIDPNSGNEVYAIDVTLRAGAMSVSAGASKGTLADAVHLIEKTGNDQIATRILSVLHTAMDSDAEPILAFSSAWTALELFVRMGFARCYRRRWEGALQSGTPAPAQPALTPIAHLTSNKMTLAIEFTIVASFLDPSNASADSIKFGNLKKIRDEAYHGGDIKKLEIARIEALEMVTKYLRLHLLCPIC